MNRTFFQLNRQGTHGLKKVHRRHSNERAQSKSCEKITEEKTTTINIWRSAVIGSAEKKLWSCFVESTPFLAYGSSVALF
jgi:hypothetical protein